MNGQQRAFPRVVGLVLTVTLAASVGIVTAGVLPDEPSTNERGMDAWSQRLARQAETDRRERANSAYSARLRLMAQERVDGAYVERLNGIADAKGLRGMSSRAAQAWTDRLDGLADRK